MADKRDYYEVLGVDKNASDAEQACCDEPAVQP